MPEPATELHYKTPFELLVAVVLSAQCTDKRVNLITPALFDRFPDASSMAEAEPEQIYNYIRSCTYPNSKARYLSGISRSLVDRFSGELPESIADLESLPGVGRKTANVVASVLFGKEVMPVDTHVFRVSARLGLTRNAGSPEEAERQLISIIPPSMLPVAHHWLILHGRYTCKARRPLCDRCGITLWCDYFSSIEESG